MAAELRGMPDPSRFGRYTLVDRLAVGGMAEIFLARQEGPEGFEKTVVLKRIRPHLSSQKSFVAMFLNEARLAAQLNHPNIVQIYDLGRIGDAHFIAMEYVFGRDMRRIIPKADALGIPFPMVYALKIASSVCEGLFYAHQKKDVYGNPLHIVHRDITPENLVVSFDGTVKILDFGIAKAANQVEHSQPGEIKGKLRYMSPEQCMGKPVDHRSDLFSLGTALYEWVTGYPLFAGDSEVAILRSITEGKLNAPSDFNSDIPEAVERILMKALEKDRGARYASAWDMQYDIDQFLSRYEFTPSNIHLSNFLKQLFSDELEEERERLAARAHPSAASFPEPGELGGQPGNRPSEPIPLRPRGGQEKVDAPWGSAGGSERMLAVSVDEDTYAALKEIAQRNHRSVGAIVSEVLSDFVKYR